MENKEQILFVGIPKDDFTKEQQRFILDNIEYSIDILLKAKLSTLKQVREIIKKLNKNDLDLVDYILTDDLNKELDKIK